MVKVATKSQPKSKENRRILLIWFLIKAFLSIFSDPSGKVQRQQKCNVQRSDAVGTVKGNGYPWISAVPSDVDDVEPIGDADAKGIQYPWISPSPSIQETVIMQQTLQEPILPRNACKNVILGKTKVPDTTTVFFVWSFQWKSESENWKITPWKRFVWICWSDPMVGAIEDSNGYEQFIRSCGTLWRLPVSNRQSAEDQDSGAERRGKRSLQIHKDKHKDKHKHRD